MNTILVRNNEKYTYIENELLHFLYGQSGKIEYTDRVDKFDEEYMSYIIGLVQSTNADILFSVGFIEQYSLLCGVLKKPYVSWILDDDNGSAYSYALCNEWNIIYTSNPVIFCFLKNKNVNNVNYLPLSFEKNIDEAESVKETEDVFFWTDGITKEISINDSINGLKDATKGYLDALLLTKRAELEYGPITNSLPKYVTEDLYANVTFSTKSFLDISTFCDHSYFYPILDRTKAYVYLSVLMSNKIVDKISFAMDRINPYTNKELVRFERSDIVKEGYDVLCQYKIVVYFTKNSDEGMITQDLWNIMAKGIFVLCSADTDLSPLGGDAPDTFKNIWELENKVRYYLQHADKRQSKAKATRRKVRELGGYDSRAKKIFRGIEKAQV